MVLSAPSYFDFDQIRRYSRVAVCRCIRSFASKNAAFGFRD